MLAETVRPLLPHIQLLSRFVNDARNQRFAQVLSQRRSDICLVLENLGDEHNAGACLRTAECLGIQNIHIIERYEAFHVKDSDACKGAAKWLTLHRHGRSADCFAHLKQQGWTIASSWLQPNTPTLSELLQQKPPPQSLSPYSTEPSPRRFAFVFGNEARGVSPAWADYSDTTFMLPQAGFTQSLNVSVAVGMTLFTATQMMQPAAFLSPVESDFVHLRWLLAQIPAAKKLLSEKGLSLPDY